MKRFGRYLKCHCGIVVSLALHSFFPPACFFFPVFASLMALNVVYRYFRRTFAQVSCGTRQCMSNMEIGALLKSNFHFPLIT